MASQRLKGQEINIVITRDGSLEDTMTDIQNFNFAHQTEVISQGYLGEKSERKDEIYKGIKFDFEMHAHTADFFAFQQAVIDRAQRNTPDIVFTISGIFNFPNGEVKKLTIPDPKFGGMPINVGGRGEYAKMKFEGEAELATVDD